MKKRILSLLFTVLFIFTVAPSVFATNDIAWNAQTDTEVVYLDNGSYLTITLISQNSSPLSLTSSSSTSFVKTGSKVVDCRDKNGDLEWQYTLYSEFSVVEGTSATCTSATYTQTIYRDDWSFSNGNATKSGNTAYGVGTFKRKVLFITVDTVNIDISISCDVYGNLS